MNNNHYDVFGRFFDAEGHPTTPEILVVRGDSLNEGGTLDGPFLTAVSAARDGSMVFASEGPDGPIVVLARRSADGTRLPPLGSMSPRGPEGAYVDLGVLGPTVATATTAGSQDAADLAATPDGNAIALFVSRAGGAAAIVARFLRHP